MAGSVIAGESGRLAETDQVLYYFFKQQSSRVNNDIVDHFVLTVFSKIFSDLH